jgi:hypothetical protein
MSRALLCGSGDAKRRPNDVFVDLFSMTDGEDSDLCCHHLEDDAIVADAKLPVPLECLPKGRSKLLRSLCKAGLDRVCDAESEVAWN